MFFKNTKKQKEEMLKLQDFNRQLQENIDELETEKEQLKIYFNDFVHVIFGTLKDIQTINQMGISQYEKNKRMNALIFELNKLLLKSKIE